MSNGDWIAIGQGKANIIFGYHGSDPEKYGMVFRVRKLQSTVDDDDSELQKAVWSEILSTSNVDSVESLLQFTRSLILPRLGCEFIEIGEMMKTPRDLPCEMNLAWTGLLLRNYALFSKQECRRFALNGPTLCLEIKPKCGFLPNCHTIHPDNEIKKKATRFALQQYLKLKQRKISEMSKYCPLDLFSGDSGRMETALMDLLRTPQNNLKLFLDGKSLPITKEGFFNSSVTEALESLFNPSTVYEDLIKITIKILQTENILDKILALQLMDQYDIEGVYPLYCSSKKQLSNALLPLNQQQYRSCHAIKKNHKKTSEATELDVYFAAHGKLSKLSIEDKSRILRDYLIALSAKDCSIYLTFQVIPYRGEFYKLTHSHTFPRMIFWRNNHCLVYRIQVGDLDPKPVSKIPYQQQLDKKILLTAFKSKKSS